MYGVSPSNPHLSTFCGVMLLWVQSLAESLKDSEI